MKKYIVCMFLYLLHVPWFFFVNAAAAGEGISSWLESVVAGSVAGELVNKAVVTGSVVSRIK